MTDGFCRMCTRGVFAVERFWQFGAANSFNPPDWSHLGVRQIPVEFTRIGPDP
jgi:hypothetical protein